VNLDADPGFTNGVQSGTFTLTGGSGVANNAQGGSITITGGTPNGGVFTSIQHARQDEVDQLKRDIDDLKGMVRALVETNERLEDEIEAIKDGALLE